jgi:hypothetical protein
MDPLQAAVNGAPMTRLTLDLSEEQLERLERLAQARGISVSRLFEDMSNLLLAEADAESRFRLRARGGSGREARGLELLDQAAGQALGLAPSGEAD